ncbi:MAG TPA: anthranilate synthase component I [Gammaproteobacteria bacterium]|nr:anthranilate synthase component I [Gammaproteobacteria bacterium]
MIRYLPDAGAFADLRARGHARIPVMRSVAADLDTPLSAYLKVADAPYSYLFESVQGGERWGRYSIIGLPAVRRIEVRGRNVRVLAGDDLLNAHDDIDPLAFIETWLTDARVAPVAGLPRFSGGLVGYFGYDTVRHIEPRLGPARAPDPLGQPDILLLDSTELLVFDNLRGVLHCIVHAEASDDDAYGRACARLDDLVEQLRRRAIVAPSGRGTRAITETDFHSSFGREAFEAAVARIREYIVEGDVMQVVLAQRLSAPCDLPPLAFYRALRRTNPAPYLFYLDLGGFHVVGSSPEILVRLEDDTVTVRPLAGTRRRGQDEHEDLALEQELLADPKERAEHLMLIDLGRNDIGRIAREGCVQVTERFVIERYSQVMHIVSNVSGDLAPGRTAIDVLRATFPAGTLSGAPKVRAMEIIDELEPVKRGVYGGAVGYLGWHGNMDTAIAIRTAVLANGQIHAQAGAGVVYDSNPRAEWEETLSKARALMRAAELASRGVADD